MIGVETPRPVTWAHQNKVYACLMLFFLSNAVETQLISTGAFEISFNDVPVWSKLEVGRIPSPQELFQILDNQIKFSGASSGSRLDDGGASGRFEL
jgi:selT/selW/selH-like putative selenoprotein